MNTPINITWYGHCCLLFNISNYKILIDPYDQFLNIDVGQIIADYTAISSIAHDHGNISASLKSYTNIYPGTYHPTPDITLTAIEVMETRGTPTLIWNIKYGKFSITNFADFGNLDSIKNISEINKKTIAQTNIALIRTNLLDEQTTHYNHQLALMLCQPQTIIPIHYFPKSFIDSSIPIDKQPGYISKLEQIKKMAKDTNYPIKLIDSYQLQLQTSSQFSKQTLLFQQIHPQVKYVELPQI